MAIRQCDFSGHIRPPTQGHMFQVVYDHAANRLCIAVKGFFNPDDVASLAKEVGAKARDAREVRDDFDVIVESLEFPVQANDVADLLANIMRAGMAPTSGRAAVVVGSQLNKAQAERTLVHPKLRIFLTLEDARHWLMEEA
jgi:acyl-CoA synthetase (NDP forming)